VIKYSFLLHTSMTQHEEAQYIVSSGYIRYIQRKIVLANFFNPWFNPVLIWASDLKRVTINIQKYLKIDWSGLCTTQLTTQKYIAHPITIEWSKWSPARIPREVIKGRVLVSCHENLIRSIHWCWPSRHAKSCRIFSSFVSVNIVLHRARQICESKPILRMPAVSRTCFGPAAQAHVFHHISSEQQESCWPWCTKQEKALNYISMW
jgi:hypothetical protein